VFCHSGTCPCCSVQYRPVSVCSVRAIISCGHAAPTWHPTQASTPPVATDPGHPPPPAPAPRRGPRRSRCHGELNLPRGHDDGIAAGQAARKPRIAMLSADPAAAILWRSLCPDADRHMKLVCPVVDLPLPYPSIRNHWRHRKKESRGLQALKGPDEMSATATLTRSRPSCSGRGSKVSRACT